MAVGPTYIGGKTGNIVATAAIANVATANADATYSTNETDLINELKTKLNALLAGLRAQNLLVP